MVFRLINIIKNRSNTAISKYCIKDSQGNIKEMTSKQVKELINRGNIVEGLMIKSGRLMRCSNTNNYKLTRYNGFHVISGKKLEEFVINHIALTLNHRDIVSNIISFCNTIPQSRVLIIHGIRRTGKTVSMIQAISTLIKSGIPSGKIVYSVVTGSNVDISDIKDFLENTEAKYIFIDEITKVNNFYSDAASISDVYAVDKHIILTGTDSFVFPAVLKTNLYGRADVIHSTLVPYKEYIRVFNINSKDAIDIYKANGGTMLKTEFSTDDNVYNTLRSVIIQNIKNSIKLGVDNANVISKLSDEQAMYLIFNYIFMATMPKDNGSILTDRKALSKKVTDTLAEISGASTEISDYNTHNLPKGAAKAMLEALYELDVLGHISNFVNESASIVKQNTIEVIALIQALASETLKYNSNTGKSTGFSFENMIISNTIMWARNNNAMVGFAKYKKDNIKHEIDMVVRCIGSNGEYRVAVEIKHSKEKDTSFAKYLIDKSLEEAIGNVNRKLVVYRGNDTLDKDTGVYYVNAHKFLTNMDKWLKV